MLLGSHGRSRVHEVQRSETADKCLNKGLSEEDDFIGEDWANVSDRQDRGLEGSNEKVLLGKCGYKFESINVVML